MDRDHTDIHNVEEKLREEKLSKQRGILEASLLAQEKERGEIGGNCMTILTQMLVHCLLYQQMAL